MKRPKSNYVIQSVDNALCLLESFESEEELGVTELSRRLGVHKNNVFRLLATLEERGYIEQTPTSDRYRLSVACLELGQAFVRGRHLLREAKPMLGGLAHEVHETAHLAVLREFEVTSQESSPTSCSAQACAWAVAHRLTALPRGRSCSAAPARPCATRTSATSQAEARYWPLRPPQSSMASSCMSTCVWWRARASRLTSRSAKWTSPPRPRPSMTGRRGLWPLSRYLALQFGSARSGSAERRAEGGRVRGAPLREARLRGRLRPSGWLEGDREAEPRGE